MRAMIGVLAAMAIGLASLSLADPPALAPATGTPPAAAAPAAATSAAAASQTGPANTVSAELTVDPREKQLIAAGYKAEMRNGEKVYCRREQVLGSRLGAARHCGTVDQLAAVTQGSRDQTQQAQRSQVNPSSH